MIDSESATEELSYDSDNDLDIDRDAEGTLVIGIELLNIVHRCIDIWRIVFHRAQRIHGTRFGRSASVAGCLVVSRLHPVAPKFVQEPNDSGIGIWSRLDQHCGELYS
jgi:hypothetical protein